MAVISHFGQHWTSREVDDVVCRLSATDGYGGHAPGSECCEPLKADMVLSTSTAKTGDGPVVDFRVGPHGDFWVCTADECHEGSYEEALYFLGGRREVEG